MSTLAEYFAFAKAHPERFVNPSEGGIIILLGEDEIREAEKQEGIIELLPTPVSELERMIRENEITNTFLLVAYARAKLYGLL